MILGPISCPIQLPQIFSYLASTKGLELITCLSLDVVLSVLNSLLFSLYQIMYIFSIKFIYLLKVQRGTQVTQWERERENTHVLSTTTTCTLINSWRYYKEEQASQRLGVNWGLWLLESWQAHDISAVLNGWRVAKRTILAQYWMCESLWLDESRGGSDTPFLPTYIR